MNKDLNHILAILMADTYALYLKTQNYHWHVQGPHFRELHKLFEEQYLELAEAVDQVAERIRIKGSNAPATFKELNTLKRIADGNKDIDANQMVIELALDHHSLIEDLKQASRLAVDHQDEGTANLLANRIEAHEKAEWMLNASRTKA